MRLYLLLAFLALVISQVSAQRKRAGRRIQRFCKGSKPAPAGEYSFCQAYGMLPMLMRSEGLAKGLIEYYWDLLTNSSPTLSMERAQYLNDIVGKYHRMVMQRKRAGNLGRRPPYKAIFRRIDQAHKKDGTISKEDIYRHLRNRPLPWVVLVGFQHLDVDESGYLSREEVMSPYCRILDFAKAEAAKEGGAMPEFPYSCWGGVLLTDIDPYTEEQKATLG